MKGMAVCRCLGHLGALFVALGTAPVWAQLDAVKLQVDRDDIGLDGRLRPGTWTPLRLTVDNPSSSNRAVYCRWLLEDADGDKVISQRRVTLNPNRKEYVWLYANPSLATRAGTNWVLQVVDAEQQKLLASETLRVADVNLVGSDSYVLGVLSTARLGLDLHLRSETQHERIRVLHGLSLARLPDRWYGLSIMNTMVWASDGGAPNDAAVTAEIEQAVRNWVMRGGHLVIFVPAVGQPWTSSGLADVLPVTEAQMRRVEGLPPPMVRNLGEEKQQTKIIMTVFDVQPSSGVAVLARDTANNPLIVSGRAGFGTVTLIGLDLADRRLEEMGYPGFNGRDGVWHRVLGWQGPVDRANVVGLEVQQRERNTHDSRNPVQLADFINGAIAQSGTAALGLLAAIVIFGLYWLMAGPVCYFALKQRSALRYSWLAFVAVVGLFSAVAWGGAFLLQPVSTKLVHFSVMDMDVAGGTVRTQGWVSLYVPRFDKINVALAGEPAEGNLLASPGTRTALEDDRFLDPQSYAIDAANPNAAAVPYRSTSKTFEIDYVGSAGASGIEAWPVPQGHVRVGADSFPEGQLTHQLPGPLQDVLIVYCPGRKGNERRLAGDTPWVWRLGGTWAPGAPLEIDKPNQASWLVRRPSNFTNRQWGGEGFLGQLIGLKTGQRRGILNDANQIANNEIIQQIEMLTFFDLLPPPDFREKRQFPGTPSYRRRLGRRLDLTPHTAGRRLIIIGHLKNCPLPAPISVDGRDVAAKAVGRTVVRWLYEL